VSAAEGQAGARRAIRDRFRFRRWQARRYAGLPVRRKLLIGEAVLLLALSRLALVFVPFQFLAARFGKVSLPGVAGPITALSREQIETVQDVGWAVTRSARYVPFRAVCLPQAIAAKAMLDRRAIATVMHFGVAKKEGEPLAAHAWLDAGPIEITGFPVAGEFTEVARFL
jgi:hypothetical protein